MNIKSVTIWAAGLICLLQLPATGALAVNDTPDARVLATVNDTAITAGDFEQELAQLKAEMELRNRPLSHSQIGQLRPQLMENLVERELLYQQARQKGINIRDHWVNAALKELKDQLGGTSNLRTYLKDSGSSLQAFEERIRKGLVVRRLLRREALRNVKVSEAEIRAFYREHPDYFRRGEQVRVRQILVAVSNWNDSDRQAAALRKIQNLQQQLTTGANFAVLALTYSDDPSRTRAGDLGYLTLDQMVDKFADAVSGMQPGQISDIVKTRFGYHLIQMVDRIPPSIVSYRLSREKIERTLRRNKENEAVARYVAVLKSRASITRQGLTP